MVRPASRQAATPALRRPRAPPVPMAAQNTIARRLRAHQACTALQAGQATGMSRAAPLALSLAPPRRTRNLRRAEVARTAPNIASIRRAALRGSMGRQAPPQAHGIVVTARPFVIQAARPMERRAAQVTREPSTSRLTTHAQAARITPKTQVTAAARTEPIITRPARRRRRRRRHIVRTVRATILTARRRRLQHHRAAWIISAITSRKAPRQDRVMFPELGILTRGALPTAALGEAGGP